MRQFLGEWFGAPRVHLDSSEHCTSGQFIRCNVRVQVEMDHVVRVRDKVGKERKDAYKAPCKLKVY